MRQWLRMCTSCSGCPGTQKKRQVNRASKPHHDDKKGTRNKAEKHGAIRRFHGSSCNISATKQSLGPATLFFIIFPRALGILSTVISTFLPVQPSFNHPSVLVLESSPPASVTSRPCGRSIVRSGPSPPPSTPLCPHHWPGH